MEDIAPFLKKVVPQAGDMLVRIRPEPPLNASGWTTIANEPGKWMAYRIATGTEPDAGGDFVLRQSSFSSVRAFQKYLLPLTEAE